MTLIYKASKLTWGYLAVWLCAGLMVLFTNHVSAQELDRGETVAARFASVLQPDGLPVGAMRLYPRVSVGAFYSDNVFANDRVEKNDWAYLTTAEVALRSDTSRYFAELGARGEFERFDEFDENNSDTGKIWLSGDVDITGTSNLDGGLSYSRLTEPRTSANIAAGSLELTEYAITEVNGRYSYQPSRWSLRLDGRLRIFDWDDVDTLAGKLDNDDRDRNMLDSGLRLGYDFDEAYGMFLEGRINDVDYDQTFDSEGFERSYNGYEVRLGTELKLSGLIMGEFFLGYLSRDFDDESFDDADGLAYGADIDWVITNLITLNIAASRTTQPTTVTGASTILNSQVSLGLDYELMRNLVLKTGFEFTNQDFEDISREDDNKIFTFGAEYRMNRNIWLKAGYRYWDRDSDPSDSGGREFTINEYRIELAYQI